MSNSKVMVSISNSFSFASEKTKSNIVEYIKRENIDLQESDLRKILDLVDASIKQSFTLTSDSIMKTLG